MNNYTAINNIDNFEELINNLPGITFKCLLDDNWTMKYMSPQTLGLTGYDVTEFLSQNVAYADLIHKDDSSIVDHIIAQAIASHTSYEVEYRILTKDQQTKWVWERGKAIEIDGRAEFLEGFIQDISDIKRNEIELNHIVEVKTAEIEQQKEEILITLEQSHLANEQLSVVHRALDSSAIVSRADLKGNMLEVNDKFCETTGYDRTSLIGKNHNLVNSGYHPKEFWKEMWRTIGKGNVWRGEIRNQKKDGSYYWVDTVIAPIMDANNKPVEYFSVRFIIDERKALEQDILESNEELKVQQEELQANLTHIEDLNRHMIVKTDQINEQHVQIKSSINYAFNIQQALLPNFSDIEKVFKKCFLIFQPKDIVSGDFYWFYHNYNQNQTYMTVVDCTGHGVPGGFISMLGFNALNNIVKSRKIRRTDIILEELNREIVTDLKQQNEESKSNDGMDMSFIRVDWDTAQLNFSGAKNAVYIIRNQELIEIKADKYCIGGNQDGDNKEYTKQQIDLLPKDRIILFSDGYMDQFGGEDGSKKFMKKRFKNLLVETSSLSCDDQKDRLLLEMKQWMGYTPQIDDITLFGFEF